MKQLNLFEPEPDMNQVVQTLDMERALRACIKIRDHKKKYEAKIVELEKQYDDITTAIAQEMARQGGTTSIAVKGVGRAVKRETTRLYSTDYSEFRRWAAVNAANGALELFESRLHQGNTEAWLKEHSPNIPPGLESTTKTTIVITSE